MKRWILLGSGLGVAALGAAWGFQEYAASSDRYESAAKVGTPSRDRTTASRRAGSLAHDMDELLADGSPSAWGEIVSMYPGSDDATKRKVLERISRIERLDRAIEYVLATVGEDPTPSEHDPMVSEAEALLRDRWKTSADFDLARKMMVMQQTDKRRWVLANALTTFAKDVRDDSPFMPLKGSLAAKLIDMHSQTQDPHVKNQIVDAVNSLGDKDAALILAEGPKVRDEDLEAVSQSNAAREQASRGMSGR